MVPSDLFDETDMTSSEYAATSVGRNKTAQCQIIVIADSEMKECEADLHTSSVANSIASLPSTTACAEYLRSRRSNDLAYWMVLLGMSFVFRASVFAISYYKASRL